MEKPRGRLAELFATRRDVPEARAARFAALARQIPLMYAVLVVNTWTLAATFAGSAPLVLTVGVALVFTGASVVRLLVWWRRRTVVPSEQAARRALRRTDLVAFLLGALFSGWSFAISPYGDSLARAHVALYLTISTITCMFCLLHATRAALIVAATAGLPTLVFHVVSGGALATMAVNSALVIAVVMAVVVVQDRDFSRMVRAQVEAQRREREQRRLLRMIDDMPIAVMTIDPETSGISYVNEACRTLYARIADHLPTPAGDLVGQAIDVFDPQPELKQSLLGGPSALPHAARLRIGPELVDVTVSAISGEGGAYLGPMLTWEIVTASAEAEDRIRDLARNDSLTGLPNRVTFRAELDAALAQDVRVAVVFVNLVGFKTVNEMLGHRTGDALLQRVAKRLLRVSRGVALTVGSLGGDEFAVLVAGGDRAQAEALAGRVIAELGRPYELAGARDVRIRAAAGIALGPEHGTDSDTLLSHADIALYAAKGAGPGTVRTFCAEMGRQITERVALEVALRAALDRRDRMFVFYQPIVDLATTRVTTREALVRWCDADRGWVPPNEFVPVAEQSGLIDQLGRFVLDHACRTARDWEDGARVAVNVSAEQLGKGSLVPTVLAALEDTGLAPGRLEIEVTETALLGHQEAGVAELHRLREAGVRVALDDFGTGYSSLSHLRAFPFDTIKIDGSFVRDAVERPDCAAVVRGVAALGRALGATTVAEGVETQEQLDRARLEGCMQVQGFIYGRPAPSERDAARVGALGTRPMSVPTPRRPRRARPAAAGGTPAPAPGPAGGVGVWLQT